MKELIPVDGAERIHGFRQIPPDLREQLVGFAGIRSSEFSHHGNAFVGFRRKGQLVATGIFRTLERELLVPIAFAFAKGERPEALLPLLIGQARNDELGYAPGLKYLGWTTTEYAVWKMLFDMSGGQVFASPALPTPVGVRDFQRAVRSMFGLKLDQPPREVKVEGIHCGTLEEQYAPWWKAQIEDGRIPAFICRFQ